MIGGEWKRAGGDRQSSPSSSFHEEASGVLHLRRELAIRAVRGLTNRWSVRVEDQVPSPNRRSRGAQLNL